jgi:hypothetical protein
MMQTAYLSLRSALGRLLLLVIVIGCASLARPMAAQQNFESQLPQPRLLVIDPPGGRAGSVVELIVLGTDVENPQTLLFSNPEIKTELVGPVAAPGASAAKNVTSLAAARFRVMIPSSAPVGVCDVRVINEWGVSNPRAFMIGDLPEVVEREPNDDVEQAQRIELNTTVNGKISTPTDVDYYVVTGKKGQRVVVSCLTTTIDSRMHAGLEFYDATGRLLSENHHYHGGDALLDCALPVDGDYVVRVSEFTYTRGSPEYFYRLTVSTTPWIDAIFPPQLEAGKPAPITVYGRNLPGGVSAAGEVVDGRPLEKLTVQLEAPAGSAAKARLAFSGQLGPAVSALDGFEYRVRGPAGWSNPYLIVYAAAPVVLEREPNDRPSMAQRVEPPCTIAGRIDHQRDRDWYSFAAKKGQIYSIELLGQRIGAPADLYFSLRSASSKQPLGEFDDDPETLSPAKFFTQTGDPPRYRFSVPADGTYQVLVSCRDADFKADARRLYILRISPEQPDFRLVIMPTSDSQPDACRLMRDGDQAFTVLAWRKDGWNGTIALSAEGLPAGLVCLPQTLSPGQKQATLVVHAEAAAPSGVYDFKVLGTAVIDGAPVVREARPASITWPVKPMRNLPAPSRLDRNLVLAVRPQAPYRLDAAVDRPFIGQGDRASIALHLSRFWPQFNVPLQVVPTDLPPLISVNQNKPVVLAPGNDYANLSLATFPVTLPGMYSLVFRSSAKIPFSKDPAAKSQPATNVVLPSAPVLFTVVPQPTTAISLVPSVTAVPAGKQTEIMIKLARLHGFNGPVRIHVDGPAHIPLSAEDVVIPPGKDEVRLAIVIDKAATPGQIGEAIVRATAVVQSYLPIAQDTRLTIRVTP